MDEQIKLLKEYGITNYTIENGVITFNGWLDLSSLTSADKDFLKGTTINGGLYLNSLTSAEKAMIKSNVSQLVDGYNKEGGYCFFDGILSKVISVSVKKEYTIYTTPFEVIAQKGEYTAHAKSVKKAILDVEFKIVAKKLKSEPINQDTEITVMYYRTITGSCDSGCRSWMQNHNIPFTVVNAGTLDEYTLEINPILAKDLLPILEKSNAYGVERFRELINW